MGCKECPTDHACILPALTRVCALDQHAAAGRDWNQYQGNINQELMELAFKGLADTTLGTVNGKPTSLAQLGYNDAGLDDVWQKCGSYGPENYTYHDANGNPMVDESKFPDMKKMTDLAHSLGLTAGWCK